MAELLSILKGIIEFWPNVKWLVQTLQGTPAENREKLLGKILEASKNADATKGDTSQYEDIVSG